MFPYITNVTLVAEWHKIVNPIHLLLITLHMMLPPLLFDAHDNNQDPTALLALFARRGTEESWFWHQPYSARFRMITTSAYNADISRLQISRTL